MTVKTKSILGVMHDSGCFFEVGSLTGLEFIEVSWQATKPQESACLYLPSIGTVSACHYIQLLHEFWGSNSGSHVCLASTLIDKLSLQLKIITSLWERRLSCLYLSPMCPLSQIQFSLCLHTFLMSDLWLHLSLCLKECSLWLQGSLRYKAFLTIQDKRNCSPISTVHVCHALFICTFLVCWFVYWIWWFAPVTSAFGSLE